MKTSPLTRTFRLICIALHLLAGLIEVATTFGWKSNEAKAHAIGRWSKRLLSIMGIRIELTGEVPVSRLHGTMLVANHISWIDIFAMNTAFVARFVAKAEVRKWPLIGWMSAQSGTLFITRERRSDTGRINQEMANALLSGDCIAIFPEGSTSDGRMALPFNSSLFQPAIDAKAPVQVAALKYRDSNGLLSEDIPYIGEMSLVESILRIVSAKQTIAELHFFAPISTEVRNRRDIAKMSELLINEYLIQNQGVVATEPEKSSHHQVE